MTERQRWALITAGVAVLAFAIGAGWQYTRAAGFGGQLTDVRRDLTYQRLQSTLGAATIEAQRGNHELARQLVSTFFSGLQDVIGTAPRAAQQSFREILAERDNVITALSRGDPASGSLLAQQFITYRLALGEQIGPQNTRPAPATPAAAADTA